MESEATFRLMRLIDSSSWRAPVVGFASEPRTCVQWCVGHDLNPLLAALAVGDDQQSPRGIVFVTTTNFKPTLRRNRT